MDKAIREALKSVVTAGQKFMKAANAIVDAQFGDSIQKSAGITTDAIVEAGYAEASRRDVLKDELVYNKEASLETVRRFAERQSVIDGLGLGQSEEVKSASAGKSRDEVWNNMWGFN